MISLMPYIGGKHRMAKEIAKRLHATGADTLVYVFGGSAAVTLNSGFRKRVYNDKDGDLVNLFKVLSDADQRKEMLRKLRWTPCSRKIFLEDAAIYKKNGFSFSSIQDAPSRARATLYRALLAFGGKVRSGGFAPSAHQDRHIKEVVRYRSVLKKLAAIGEFFRGTLIENLDYQDCISKWGRKSNTVLFCDPPYMGTESYYSCPFSASDHIYLSQQLSTCKSAVVLTYYDSPAVRVLYPSPLWAYEIVTVTRNSQIKYGNKPKASELILTKGVL